MDRLDQRPLALPKIKLIYTVVLRSLCPCPLTHLRTRNRENEAPWKKNLLLGFWHGQPRGGILVIIRMGWRPTGSLGGAELQSTLASKSGQKHTERHYTRRAFPCFVAPHVNKKFPGLAYSNGNNAHPIRTRQLESLVRGIGMLAVDCKGQEAGQTVHYPKRQRWQIDSFRLYAVKISTSLPGQPDADDSHFP